MIVKVKEPIAPEYPRMREGQLLFTYLHLAPDQELTDQLLKRKVTGIAYETITDRRGGLAAADADVRSCRPHGHSGRRPLSREDGRRSRHSAWRRAWRAGSRVVIIGGGVVGTNAAKIAVGMGAHVTIIDNNLERLRELDDIFLSKISTLGFERLHDSRRDFDRRS